MRAYFRFSLLVLVFCVPMLLTVSFALLKQIEVISWPWLWIWSPVWIAVAGYLAVISIAGLALRFMVRTGSNIP